MPFFVSALLGGLLNIAGTLAGQVLIGLGISVVTYTGLSLTLDALEVAVASSLTGLGSEMVGIIKYMGVGKAISVVFAAYTVRLTLSGLTNGTLKAWVKK